MNPLSEVLATLRAASFVYRTGHWTVIGPNYYGNHLLLMRLYEEAASMEDTVGERVVGYYGAQAVDMDEQLTAFHQMAVGVVGRPVIDQARAMAYSIRAAATKAYETLRAGGNLPLDTDDLLMKVADMAATHIYLLNQITRESP